MAANSAGTSNTVSTLNGLFKVRYAEKLLPLVPEFALLQKLVEFERAKKVGSFYAQPVQLASENGFTYLGSSGAVGALVDPVAGVLKEAQVTPSELNLAAYMSNASITRAMESEAAFMRETKWKVTDMNNSMRRRLEIACLYGQTDIGVVEAVTFSTTTQVTITAATWAGGIWAGMEGAKLDAFTGNTLNGSGGHKIQTVDSDTRTLHFATDVSADFAVGDTLHFTGSKVSGGTSYNEMAGLKKIISNTGTLFGIDAATYSLWKGNTVSSIGALSFSKLQTYISLAVNKGLMEKVAVFVSPKAWAVLNSNESALRVYDNSYKTASFENGATAIKYHSQNGLVEVYSHPCVKDGDLFIVPLALCLRIGSVDLSFGLPGENGQETYFDRVPGYNAVQLQAMADQALFLEKPALAVFGSGITY